MGLYLHIPFCKQACHYCNFHFSTSTKNQAAFVDALLLELELRKDFLDGVPLGSIYFGGGTPSLLTAEQLDRIFKKIFEFHLVEENAEITLEANPDDLTPEKLRELAQSPVNRLSIGLQSLSEEDLRFMNRAHTAEEAHRCIELSQEAGFNRLTVDLIYGSPTTSDAQWLKNLDFLIERAIPHLSCYALTVEPQTALDHFIRKGKAPAVDEEQAARQFEIMLERLRQAGYEQYEISNFARGAQYAIHNSNYWRGKPYLGIGPSAHSYDGQNRYAVVANNTKYIRTLQEGELASILSIEKLTPTDRYHEYLLTGLRTRWGCQLDQIPFSFQEHFLQQIQAFLKSGKVARNGNTFTLTDSGKLLADHITSSLFI